MAEQDLRLFLSSLESARGAFTTVGKVLKEQKEQKQDEDTLKQLNNKELTPVQRASLIPKLSPKGQKSFLSTQLFENKIAKDAESTQRYEDNQIFKNKREGRLKRAQDIQTLGLLYKAKIADLREQVKDTNLEHNKKPILGEISKLQKEFATNANRINKGKKPEFKLLQIETEETSQPAQTPQQQVQQPQTTIGAPQTFPTKMKWNPNDPLQKKRAAEVLQKTNGDRGAANNILAQEFEM